MLNLELKKNKLVNCDGLKNLKMLRELYLNENKISDISGLADLPMLKKLDLNTNKMNAMANLPNLPSLEELDLSNNLIADDKCLPYFGLFKNLKTLILTGCPYAEEKGDGLKGEVLVILGTVLNI